MTAHLTLPLLGAVCAGAGFAIADGLVDWLTDRDARILRARRRDARRVRAAQARAAAETVAAIRRRAGR